MSEDLPGIKEQGFAAILSIHDVMPETLDEVADLLMRISAADAGTADLLVVPGKAWTSRDLDRLRVWRSQGHRLAGHGWHHRAAAPRSLYHRCHSVLLSRDVAEHLSLSSIERSALMSRCHVWFEEHGFESPELYVPPAWAAGDRTSFNSLPPGQFRYMETLRGIHDRLTGQSRWLPLVGFEADTRSRAAILSVSNRLSFSMTSLNRPVRIGLHPKDRSHQLGATLDELLEHLPTQAVPITVDELFNAFSAPLE